MLLAQSHRRSVCSQFDVLSYILTKVRMVHFSSACDRPWVAQHLLCGHLSTVDVGHLAHSPRTDLRWLPDRSKLHRWLHKEQIARIQAWNRDTQSRTSWSTTLRYICARLFSTSYVLLAFSSIIQSFLLEKDPGPGSLSP